MRFGGNNLMDEFYQINQYLPLLYDNDDETTYIQTLFKAFELSYMNGIYQFAYIQLHMIFMVCIYYILLKINIIMPNEMEKALFYMLKGKDRVKQFYAKSNTKDGQLYFGSFAVLNESDVFLLLKLIDMDTNLQGELSKLVEERNKYAHANGNLIITSEKTINEKISIYIGLIERVFKLLKPFAEKKYIDILSSKDFYDAETRDGFSDNEEQIKQFFIKSNHVSQKEANFCRKIDISKLAENDDYFQIRELHLSLCNYYKILSEE